MSTQSLSWTLAFLAALAPCACEPALDVGTVPGAMIGVFEAPGQDTEEAQRARFSAREQIIGRHFALDRLYRKWDDAIPGEREAWTVANGRVPVVSFNGTHPDGSAPVTWDAVASGAEDARLNEIADGFRALAARAFIIYHNEPEDSSGLGSAEAYREAYRHVVTLFRQRGANEIAWVFNAKRPSFEDGRAMEYYPGDDVIDWIGVNAILPMVGDAPGSWHSLRSLILAARDFAASHEKPLLLAEWGTYEQSGDPQGPRSKSRWILEAADVVREWPELRALVYYDDDTLAFDTSEASASAFRAVALDPALSRN